MKIYVKTNISSEKIAYKALNECARTDTQCSKKEKNLYIYMEGIRENSKTPS